MNAETYLSDHSLNGEFITKTFGVVIGEKEIVIPVYDESGKLLFSKIRHLDYEERKAAGDTKVSKFTHDTLGSHSALFCLHLIKNVKEVVLCEGEPDAMRLWQEKIPAVTPTTGVKKFDPKLAAALKGKKVYLCLDTDKAGTSEIEKYYQTLEAAGAFPEIISLPADYKDVSVYFTAGHTGDDFRKLIASAENLNEWLLTNQPKEYAIVSGIDLMARPLTPDQWLMERILPIEGFCFIVGAEATGKSFYTLSIAQAVTTGTPWLGKFPVKKPTKVLFIDKENTQLRTQRRMKGLGMDGKDMYWLEYPHYFELADDKEDDGLSAFAKSVSRFVKQENIGLIIVDSFADVMIGNENAAADVQGFFDALKKLLPHTSILPLHHVNKPSQGVPRTAAQRTRGSTNIMAQVYSALYVEAVPKQKGVFTIEQIKSGDSEKFPKFRIVMQTKPDPEDANQTIVTGLKYDGEVQDAEAKIDEAVAVISDALDVSGQLERKQLLDICEGEGVSQSTARRAIKQLTDDGIIDSLKSGRKLIYILVDKKTPEGGEINEQI